MEKIASFQINHDVLVPGIYTSRVDFGDIVTYDLRFKRPNNGDALTKEAAHTIEHIFATYIRSSKIGANVVYFGPMGCLTGFYLILKGVSAKDAIAGIQAGMKFLSAFEGEIPGSRKEECGNYLMHDLAGAKKEAAGYCAAIEGWTERQLVYPE